jgi:hypothetical protein
MRLRQPRVKRVTCPQSGSPIMVDARGRIRANPVIRGVKFINGRAVATKR